MRAARYERTCDVPRSVWDWATQTLDSRTCEDVWRLVCIRQVYRQRVRHTVLRGGLLFGAIIGVVPMIVRGDHPALEIPAYALTIALMNYLVLAAFTLRRIGHEAFAIRRQDIDKWLKIGETLDPLMAAHRKGAPVLTVTFQYPDVS